MVRLCLEETLVTNDMIEEALYVKGVGKEIQKEAAVDIPIKVNTNLHKVVHSENRQEGKKRV